MISSDELLAARANLYRHQVRLNCFPSCTVIINDRFTFWTDDRTEDGSSPGAILDGHFKEEPRLECYLPDDLLRDILDRKVHWNNAEIGCHIRFHRTGPYLPDVHMLMSYFHLPRPT